MAHVFDALSRRPLKPDGAGKATPNVFRQAGSQVGATSDQAKSEIPQPWRWDL